MQSFAPIRFAIAASIALFSVSLSAQSPQAKPPTQTQTSSTLPATQPTVPEQPQVPLTPSQRPPKRAQVTYADGMLSVSADNSSLNQILRQIATNTGMNITGGVTDERVFGQYGPGDTAHILAELLDGTGSNMIFVHRDDAEPAELILTPRQGGPSPPNPAAATFDDKPDPRDTSRQSQQSPPNPPETPPQPDTSAPPANPAAPNGATNPSQPDSPNGVKTPQQIYEQLQRLRSQQTQPQAQPQLLD
jgi:hypothetical protein